MKKPNQEKQENLTTERYEILRDGNSIGWVEATTLLEAQQKSY